MNKKLALILFGTVIALASCSNDKKSRIGKTMYEEGRDTTITLSLPVYEKVPEHYKSCSGQDKVRERYLPMTEDSTVTATVTMQGKARNCYDCPGAESSTGSDDGDTLQAGSSGGGFPWDTLWKFLSWIFGLAIAGFILWGLWHFFSWLLSVPRYRRSSNGGNDSSAGSSYSQTSESHTHESTRSTNAEIADLLGHHRCCLTPLPSVKERTITIVEKY